jgi:hypothetical protein
MNWSAIFVISVIFGVIAGVKGGPILPWAILAAIVAGTLSVWKVI